MNAMRKTKSMFNLNKSNDSVASTINLTMKKEQSMRLLTIDVSTALKLDKLPNFNVNDVLLEIYAEILSIRAGTFKTEKLILLRSPNEKPVMQTVYYEADKPLASLTPGQMVRVVGHLIGNTRRFRVLKISAYNPAECDELIQRLKSMSNFELTKIQTVNRK